MIKFKHESIIDQDGIENLLDLVFSPSRINLSSYSLRKKVPKVKTLCFVAKNTDGSIIGVIRYWPVLIGEKKSITFNRSNSNSSYFSRRGLGGLLDQSLNKNIKKIWLEKGNINR